MYAAYETAMTVKEAVKTGAWKAGNAIKNILVSAATSLISAMSPVGSIGALLLNTGIKAGASFVDFDGKGSPLEFNKQNAMNAGLAVASGAAGAVNMGRVLNTVSTFSQSAIQNSVKFDKDGKFDGLDLKGGLAAAGFSTAGGLAAEYATTAMDNAGYLGSSDGSFLGNFANDERKSLANKFVSNTVSNVGMLAYSNATGTNMGEYYQQGYHNSTADYAGRVAGYAGTSLKESRQSKAQTPTQNKTRDSAEDSRPKLPFADFIDDLANAAWVGVKKANETILNVQSAIMNGAIGLGSAAIGGLSAAGGAVRDSGVKTAKVFEDGVKDTNDFLFGKTVTSTIHTEAGLTEAYELGGEAEEKWVQVDGKDVKIEKDIPGLFENMGIFFMKNFGNDRMKLKAMVRERGDKWNDEGVNIVGLRNNDVASGQNKFDDIFVVVNDNKIKGAFMGSTDPGRTGKAHLIEGQHIFGFESQEERDEARSRGEQVNEYHNDVLRPVDANIVQRDHNTLNGVIDGVEKDHYHSTNGATLFHYGGRSDWDVNNFSKGCQTIAMDKTYNAVNDLLIDYNQTDHTIESKQGAYNDFLDMVGRTSNNNIRHNIINKNNNNEALTMYNKYLTKLKMY